MALKRRGVPKNIFRVSPEWNIPAITISGVMQQALIWNPIFLLGPVVPAEAKQEKQWLNTKDQNFPLHHQRNPLARKKNVSCYFHCSSSVNYTVLLKKHYNKIGPSALSGLCQSKTAFGNISCIAGISKSGRVLHCQRLKMWSTPLWIDQHVS